MNWSRVLIGGLLAGLVVNIGEYVLNGVILKEDWDAAAAALGMPTMTTNAILVMVVMSFLLGIVLVWLYAGLRARYGPGPMTAVRVGLVAWLLLGFFPYVWNLLMPIFPVRLMGIGLAWGLFELPIAAIVGAWVYREDLEVVPSRGIGM